MLAITNYKNVSKVRHYCYKLKLCKNFYYFLFERLFRNIFVIRKKLFFDLLILIFAHTNVIFPIAQIRRSFTIRKLFSTHITLLFFFKLDKDSSQENFSLFPKKKLKIFFFIQRISRYFLFFITIW